jgi:uncharacterized protein (DUF608 family)
VPLGGIGCGKVEICRDGRFRNFTGNNNQDAPFEPPEGLDGAYLSVSCNGAERLLATRPMASFHTARSLEADLRFPQAELRAAGVLPDLDVKVRLSGTTVPHDLDLSALPGFLLRWTVENRGPKPQTVRCRLGWPNLIGTGGGNSRPESNIGFGDGWYLFFEAPTAQRAEAVAAGPWQVLRYTNAPNPLSALADGEHLVAVRGGKADTRLDTHPTRGSVAREVLVPADGSATVDMAVVWDMPHWIDLKKVERGHYWQNLCKDGLEILARLGTAFDEILDRGGQLAALVAETDLPDCLQKRLSNCNYPLVTNSVHYRDGRFSINEGPTEMVGCYGTIDQRLGAHPGTMLLYPALNAQELAQFTAIQAPNGGVAHDLGHGELERGPTDQPWPDIPCSFIIQHAAHAWYTGDAKYEAALWPAARRALLRHAEWAEEGDGVAQVGYGLGTSYDGYHYYGTTPYMATLWIATLQIARRWAERQGDRGLLPRLDAWLAKARHRMEEDLWNGRFYRAYSSRKGAVNENLHAGLLAGEIYARTLAGTDILPEDRLDSCAEAWKALAGSERFAVPPDEVSPEGKATVDFGWLPYVESFGVACLAARGDRGVLPVWERILTAMDGRGKHPCDTRLMYEPHSGLPSWGAYYMTAPASWLVYQGLLDFVYRPAEETLRLNPCLDGRFALVHPRFWAVGSRRVLKSGLQELSLTVKHVFGEGALNVTRLEAPKGAVVKIGGQECPRSAGTDRYDLVTIPPAALRPGTTLSWTCLP